jgi:hypothetical protein
MVGAEFGTIERWQLRQRLEKESAAAKLENWAHETNAIRQAAIRLFGAIRAAKRAPPPQRTCAFG